MRAAKERRTLPTAALFILIFTLNATAIEAQTPFQGGFDPDAPPPPESVFLLEINERLSLLEGELRSLTGRIEELTHFQRRLIGRLEALEDQGRQAAREAEAAANAWRTNLDANSLQSEDREPPGIPENAVDAAVEEANENPFPRRPVASRPALRVGGDETADETEGETPSLAEDAEDAEDAAAAEAGTPASLTGEAVFAWAYERLLNQDFDAARLGLQDYLDPERNPQRPLNQGGEAYFWLGEIDVAQRRYDSAIAHYRLGANLFADSPRAPELLLKLATTLNLLGRKQRACRVLTIVPDRYPEALGRLSARLERQKDLAACQG